VPGRERIPVAADKNLTTLCARRAAALLTVNIPRVHVPQTLVDGDLAGAGQGTGRGPFAILHAEVRMEGRKVHGHFGPQILPDPDTLGFDFLV